ncbi:MAG TPA: PPC domain-containing protein [Thermoanaerobaculia bacterium]|nr:PPC domain-containing protein [Thermoanaerobaculia bacterium]
MFTKFASPQASLGLAGLLLLLLGGGAVSAAGAQQLSDCAAALQTSGGGVSLANAATATATKKVDEWDGDILKIVIDQPGVLVLSGEGSDVEGALYAADPDSGEPVLEDGGTLGTVHPPLTLVVQPGEHCVQVTPPAEATGNLSVVATFFDVCSLGPQDDHGDSFLCATEIALGEEQTGEISPATDQDVFSFTLDAETAVTISVAGGTGASDLIASLYGEDGTLLAADARGSRTLAAGQYFVRIDGGTGSGGSYTVAVAGTP